MKICGIYKITSPSGKIYIGQSWDLEDRKKRYKSLKCKRQPKIYNSLKKYGFDAHIFEIIKYLDENNSQEDMNYYEIFFWKKEINNGSIMLNLKEPGSRGKHSQETKDKISALHKGKKFTEEHKKNMSIARIGKPHLKNYKHSLETIKKIKETLLDENRIIKNRKKIYQYDINGNFIREYVSLRNAARYLNINSGDICNCVNGKLKSIKGNIFYYVKK